MLRTTAMAACCLMGALLPLSAPHAFAGDYCISNSGKVSSVYVGKDFMLPKSGACATWRGFCKTGCSPDNVQTGVACTASNGSHVSFGLTTYYLAGNRQFDWVRLDLPKGSGSGNFDYENPALGSTNYTAKGASCSGGSVP